MRNKVARLREERGVLRKRLSRAKQASEYDNMDELLQEENRGLRVCCCCCLLFVYSAKKAYAHFRSRLFVRVAIQTTKIRCLQNASTSSAWIALNVATIRDRANAQNAMQHSAQTTIIASIYNKRAAGLQCAHSLQFHLSLSLSIRVIHNNALFFHRCCFSAAAARRSHYTIILFTFFDIFSFYFFVDRFAYFLLYERARARCVAAMRRLCAFHRELVNCARARCLFKSLCLLLFVTF